MRGGEGWSELRAVSVNPPASGSRVPGGTERGALRLFQGLLERQKKGKGSPAGFSPGSREAPLGTQEPSRAPEPLPAGPTVARPPRLSELQGLRAHSTGAG